MCLAFFTFIEYTSIRIVSKYIDTNMVGENDGHHLLS